MQWNKLSIQDKAALMRIYIENGITDLDVMQAHYNQQGGKVGRNNNSANSHSSLPNNSRTYERWADAIARHKGINIVNDKTYDYRRYYNENTEAAWRMLQANAEEHFPDTYKLPVHPTFSNESIYSRGPMMGGNWVNDSTFTPSTVNRQYHPGIYKENRNYTEREIYSNNYQKGGPVDNKSDWAKAHETELALHQLGWDNPNNRLQSDYAVKDPDGYYPGYNLKPVTIKAEHPIRQWDKTISLDSPYLKDLYQHYLNREEAGKEYLKNIGRVGLTIGTLPLLGYGLAAAPLTTGLSVLGGEGLNYGVKKLTPYQSWGNLLAQGVFNTDNELAQTALEYTNPGFLLGPKVTPFVNNQYRGLKVANELRKGINNATKYGDIRVNETSFRDPTKFYRFVEQPEVNTIRELGFNVTSTDASKLGANISSNANRFRLNTLANKARQAKNNNTISIIKRGSAHGNVSQAAAGRPWQSSVAQSDGLFRRGLLEGNLYDGVLASTSSRSVFKPTQMSDLFSGQRIGFKTNTMPTENLRYFEDLGNGIFRYNGKVIPEKREYVLGRFQNGGSLGHITPFGQWQYPGKVTTIPSNNITMQGVNYPVIGISDKGDTKLMMPNRNYQFKGKSVTEYPLI